MSSHPMRHEIPEKPPFRSAFIVGLGLIGGSLARDLRAQGVIVLGHDRDPGTVTDAEIAGIIPVASLPDAPATDVVIFATPLETTMKLLPKVASTKLATLVTDVSSTKQSVVAAAVRAKLGENFVGAHPMAGDHRRGWAASRQGLFAGARVYLCPAQGANAEAVALADTMWRLVGGQPTTMGAALHDRQMAWISHLPHMASALLAEVLKDANIGRTVLGPGGRDVTRLAGGDTRLWTEIALDNGEALIEAIRAMEQKLAALRKSLKHGDRHAIEEQLVRAHEWFWGSEAPNAKP